MLPRWCGTIQLLTPEKRYGAWSMWQHRKPHPHPSACHKRGWWAHVCGLPVRIVFTGLKLHPICILYAVIVVPNGQPKHWSSTEVPLGSTQELLCPQSSLTEGNGSELCHWEPLVCSLPCFTPEIRAPVSGQWKELPLCVPSLLPGWSPGAVPLWDRATLFPVHIW